MGSGFSKKNLVGNRDRYLAMRNYDVLDTSHPHTPSVGRMMFLSFNFIFPL